MRILLDSRDLIDLLEHQQPIAAAEFDAYLRAGNHQIVLCFTNVRELCGPLGAGGGFKRVAPFLRSADEMPRTYLKEVSIIPAEIQFAVEAFNGGTEYQECSPNVARWDQTLESHDPESEAALEEYLAKLGLVLTVFLTYRGGPAIFAPPQRYLAPLQAQFENDRNHHRAGQARDPQHFIDCVKRYAERARVNVPDKREAEFARWIYANPNRCPGLRLHHETYRALMENYGDIPETGDFSDLAHICAIPYVDAATLDRRMRQYCTVAARRMIDAGAVVNYSDRVYANVTALMQRHPNV